MKIQGVLSTGVGVLLVSKVEVLGDDIELNCWKKRKRKDDSDRSFRLPFSDRKTQARFQILICRGSRYGQTEATCNRKVPQHTPFHFLLVSSKILVFAESCCNAMMNRARKRSKIR